MAMSCQRWWADRWTRPGIVDELLTKRGGVAARKWQGTVVSNSFDIKQQDNSEQIELTAASLSTMISTRRDGNENNE